MVYVIITSIILLYINRIKRFDKGQLLVEKTLYFVSSKAVINPSLELLDDLYSQIWVKQLIGNVSLNLAVKHLEFCQEYGRQAL